MEGKEVPHGWPFGLGNMNPIMAADDSQAAAPPQPYATRVHRSSSFSSFSSSNLDTESTASFFPDQSVSLGRLIGINPVQKGRLLHHLSRHVATTTANFPKKAGPIQGYPKAMKILKEFVFPCYIML